MNARSGRIRKDHAVRCEKTGGGGGGKPRLPLRAAPWWPAFALGASGKAIPTGTFVVAACVCRCTILRSPKTLLCQIRKTQWMDNVLHERLALNLRLLEKCADNDKAWAKYDLNRLLGRAHQFLPSTHDGYPKGTRHDHLDAHVCNSGLRAVQSSRQPVAAAHERGQLLPAGRAKNGGRKRRARRRAFARRCGC